MLDRHARYGMWTAEDKFSPCAFWCRLPGMPPRRPTAHPTDSLPAHTTPRPHPPRHSSTAGRRCAPHRGTRVLRLAEQQRGAPPYRPPLLCVCPGRQVSGGWKGRLSTLVLRHGVGGCKLLLAPVLPVAASSTPALTACRRNPTAACCRPPHCWHSTLIDAGLTSTSAAAAARWTAVLMPWAASGLQSGWMSTGRTGRRSGAGLR